jgi:hypothetical protein
MLPEHLLGKTVAGRLKVSSLLGESALAYRYLAVHVGINQQVEIQVLRQDLTDEPELMDRFRREARAVSRVVHPGLVYVSDFGQSEDGRPYLVTERAAGITVREAIERTRPGVLPVPRVLAILQQVAEALTAAHRAGYLHHDLKPESLRLVTDHLGEERVKVEDLGLARIAAGVEWDAVTQVGQVFGTLPYMSPEQIQGHDLDPRTDLYSLGVIAFELLTGRRPFERDTVRGWTDAHRNEPPPPLSTSRPGGASRLPAGLEALVLRCLAKAPDARPRRASDLAEALAALLAETRLTRVSSHDELRRQVRETAVPGLHGPGPAVDAPVTPAAPVAATAGSGPTEAPEARDARLRELTLSVAATLRDQRLGTAELTRGIVFIRENDEQLVALQGKIASLTRQLQEIQTETDDRAARLRHAVVDLRMERERLAGDPGDVAALAVDLDYQIAALERRLAETLVEQEDACEARKTQLRRLRPAAVDLRLLAQHFTSGLLQLILGLAPQVTEPGLLRSIEELRQWMAESG